MTVSIHLGDYSEPERPDTSGCTVFVPPEGCPDRPYCAVHSKAPCAGYYAKAPEGDRRCSMLAEHWVTSRTHVNRAGFAWSDEEAKAAYEASGPLSTPHRRHPSAETAEIYPDFDGCSRRCRKAGQHTREQGCEFAPTPPPPMPVLPTVSTGVDGFPSVGYEPITWEQAAAMLADDAQRMEERRTAPTEGGAESKTYGYVIVETTHDQGKPRVRVYDNHPDGDVQDITERAAMLQSHVGSYGRLEDTYVVCQLVEVPNA